MLLEGSPKVSSVWMQQWQNQPKSELLANYACNQIQQYGHMDIRKATYIGLREEICSFNLDFVLGVWKSMRIDNKDGNALQSVNQIMRWKHQELHLIFLEIIKHDQEPPRYRLLIIEILQGKKLPE